MEPWPTPKLPEEPEPKGPVTDDECAAVHYIMAGWDLSLRALIIENRVRWNPPD